MKHLWIGILIVALATSSTGCGSTGGGSGSGLPQSSTVVSLTSTQLATLCDWEDAKQGGYGRMVTCADGSTQVTDTNQSACVASAITLAGC